MELEELQEPSVGDPAAVASTVAPHPDPPPPPITIAAAPVAPPIAGIRRALARIEGFTEVCRRGAHNRGSAFLYFLGDRGGAGGGSGAHEGAMSGGSRDRSSWAVGLCLSVVHVVPLPLARDHGRDSSVGSCSTPCLTCPCAPAPPLLLFAVRLDMIGTIRHSDCR